MLDFLTAEFPGEVRSAVYRSFVHARRLSDARGRGLGGLLALEQAFWSLG